MIRVAVHGAAGRMGGHVLQVLAESPDLAASAAVDRPGHPRQGEPVGQDLTLGSDLEAALETADVVIDFSLPEALPDLLAAAERRKLPVVVATTGLGTDDLTRLRSAAQHIPIVYSANFSLGIFALDQLVEHAARLLPDYEIEVLELHHSAKVDAPSGTALRLAQTAADARERPLQDVAVYHREGHTGPRPADAIGLQTLRAGSSAGEHTVFLAGPGERLELTHRAQSRDVFARGAVHAARWLATRPAGFYGMRDIFG